MTTTNKRRKHHYRKSSPTTSKLMCESLEDRRLLDAAGPRIVASSLQPGEVVAAGDLDIHIQFDEDIVTDGLEPADIGLTGERFGVRDFAAFDYDVDTHTITVSFLQLGEDNYTLTLSSEAFKDLMGNELDGENAGLVIPPDVSGDGMPGGDFILDFTTDIVIQSFPVPLDPVLPLGSLVYEGEAIAEISTGDDEDQFTIDVDAARNMTIIVTPAADFRPAISLFAADMTLIGSAEPFADGQPAVLSSASLPSAGEYTIGVGSSDGSAGQFELRIILNAAAEVETFGGARNDRLATAQDLADAFVSLGDGSVEHAAVLGMAETSLLDLSPTLVPAGSVWKFLDDGSNQGTAWREPDFDDSTWESGAAELGYGDGDETTVVGFVETNFGKNLTTYFRHSFQLDDDPARFVQMALELKRDDGAAVYLNGVEIARDNLAPNATFDQGASGTATGIDESEFHQFLIGLDSLPADLLRVGENVVAVEVHQESAESPDLSFDLELEAFATGPGGTDIEAPTFVTTGSTWSYLDDGSNQGTAWRQPAFDDSSWSSGPAILGYGNGDVSTIVDFGSNSQQKYITTYFRHRFVVDDDPDRFEQVFLELLRDEGAAVFLNGFEISRENLAANASFDDPATRAADDPLSLQLIDLRTLPPGVLRQGENVLAVEIHQDTRNGSDILFDLSLRGFGSEAERRDWYRLDLRDGETATIGVQKFAAGEVHLDLFDASGETRLATGVGADNVDQLISGFTDVTSDGSETAYYIQVDGDGTNYDLFVTRNADFDSESNRSFNEAQQSVGALGALTASGPGEGTLLADFPGISSRQAVCNCEPPDTHLAAGPEHVVEVVNTAIAIYNKDGSTASEPLDLALFFSPEVVAGELFLFDPVVTYDDLAQRFVVASVIGATASIRETDLLFAVSDTSDPTGSWSEQQRIDFGDISPGLLADFPKFGWNADAYVFSLNMFDESSAFVTVNVATINKSTALDADAATNSHFISERANSFTMVPSTMHEAQPGDPMWFVEEENPQGGDLIRVVRMTNVLSTDPLYSDFPVSISPYESPPVTPQGDGKFNVNDSRILSAEWRDDQLAATHAVALDGETAVRWYEFETSGATPTLSQEGTIDPGSGVHAFFPSIAINAAGDIGLTYLQSSDTQFVSMYVTGHKTGTLPGNMVPPILVEPGDHRYLGFRGGDYSGISVDPISDSFWAANEIIISVDNALWNTWIGEFTLKDILDDDWYSIPADAGSQLTVATLTPGADAGEPLNSTDVAIELFAPDGTFITSSSNDAGGLDAEIVHQATDSGDYRVRVFSENDTRGEYYLTVDGASDTPVPPEVVRTFPTNGLISSVFPTSVTVTFSKAILLDSISAEDVLIGGEPALSMTVLDGRTFEFSIDSSIATSDGEYTIELSADAVLDLAGVGNAAHASFYIVDQTGPQIIGTTWNGQSFPSGSVFEPGPLTITAKFDEPLFTLSSARRGLRSPGTDDVVLTDMSTGENISPQSLEFDPETNTLTVDYGELAKSEYMLRLISGDGGFEDVVGNDLDGEPLEAIADGTPTGDGIPGGDWTIDFNVDLTQESLNDFVRLDPLGGFAAKQHVESNLGFRNLDRYDVFAPLGKSLTAIATPSDPTVVLHVNGNSAPAPGQAAVFAMIANVDGFVSLDVTGTAATDYTLDVFRDATLEAAVGDTNAESALPLDDFLLPIGGGLASVVGTATPYFGDLVVVSEDFADGLNDFVVDNDYQQGGGLWHLSAGRSADGDPNHTRPNSLYYGKGEGSTGGGDFDTGTGNSGAVELPSIDLPMSPNISLSFQYLLDRGRGQMSRDELAEVAVNDGSGFVTLLSTDGESLSGDTGGQWQTATADLTAYAESNITLRFTFNTVGAIASNTEGWYIDDISIFAEMALVPDEDVYSIDLSDQVGKRIDVVLAGHDGADLSDVLVELVDPAGAVAARGASMPLGMPPDGFEVAILDYVVPDLGDNVYGLRIRSDLAGEYGAVVTESMMFGIEPNQAAVDTLRLIDSSTFALGFLDIAADPIDSYLVNLPAGRPVLLRVETPSTHPQSSPENTLLPQLSFSDSSNSPLPGFVETIEVTDMGVVLTATETADVQVAINAESGLGEYLLEVDIAALNGDFSDDSLLNCTDLDSLTSAVITGENLSFDVSADGVLDENDLLLWLVLASHTNFGSGEMYRPGDANLDGTVDGVDFDIWSSNRFTQIAGWCNGDFNIDGQVDVSDFNIWNDNRFSAGVAATSLPDGIARSPRAPAAIPAIGLDFTTSAFRHDFTSDDRAATAGDIVFGRARLIPTEWQNLESEMKFQYLSQRTSRDVAAIHGDDADSAKTEQPLGTNIIDKVFSNEATWL